LPDGVTLQGLLDVAVSKPHNPKITNAFFRSGQIEAWGRGLQKIIDGCIADGLPAPELKISPTMFTAYFHIRNNNKAIAERETDLETDKAIAPYATVNATVNVTQARILELLANDPRMTVTELISVLKIHERNVKRNIKSLKDNGFLIRVGSDKTGHWEVKG
jgi:ATP-dependent DNA helicase RecG